MECVHGMTGYCENLSIYPVSIRTALYTLELHELISTRSFQEKSSHCAYTRCTTKRIYIYKSIMRAGSEDFSPRKLRMYLSGHKLIICTHREITEYMRGGMIDYYFCERSCNLKEG